ncbi:paraquat-inducible protein B [Escherichia coli]|uniref:Paraquat-inducible protein B n=1 Tax=Escherichia coli TaxID=562 RepID=A0A376UC98_ECOLX|nr:paraquat-inducible protein B [Escherichia coli]
MTNNVRFWKDSGIAVDLTSAGMRVEMGSLTTLLSGGVSFDVPEGLDLGQPVAPKQLSFCMMIRRAFRIRCTPITLII